MAAAPAHLRRAPAVALPRGPCGPCTAADHQEHRQHDEDDGRFRPPITRAFDDASLLPRRRLPASRSIGEIRLSAKGPARCLTALPHRGQTHRRDAITARSTVFMQRSTGSGSSSRRGDSPIPAPGSASSSSPPRRRQSRRSSPTPGTSMRSPARVRRWRCTCSGTSRTVPTACRRWPPSASGTACAQARSTRICSRTRPTNSARSATPIQRFAAQALEHIVDSVQIAAALQQPGRVAVVRRWFELSGHRQHQGPQAVVRRGASRSPRQPRSGSAAAGRIQAIRAGVLPHGHRRLGHGAAARARRRAAGARAGRYRASLPGAEHRADRVVAARRRHARRVPLQRPPLRRRRPDARIDRPVSDLPHLPRDQVVRTGQRRGAPTSPT